MSSTSIKETSDSVENIISSLVFVPNLSGNLVITSEKLCGSQNYHSWSDAVEMWFMGQGVSDHLEKGEEKVPGNEKAIWKRVDAQLCSLLWQSLSPELIQLFRVFKSCVEVWNQAKSLYTNDVSQCYTVVNNLVNLKKDGMSMEAFLGKTQSLLTEFNKLLPTGGTPAEQIAQRENFFVVFVLSKLGPEFENTRNQILGDNVVPGIQELFKRLLQVTSFPGETSTPTTDQSALVIQGGRGNHLGNRNKDRSGQKNTRYCDYCNRSGHTRDRCWKLHGRPVLAPTNVAELKQDSGSKTISLTEYEEFARFKASAQAAVVTPVAHTKETHTALVSQSGSLGSWVLDSGASEHICGNSSLLTHFTDSKSLPSIVFGNGSICTAHGVGKAMPLPNLPLSSVLYIPTCPFNLISIRQLTHSLDCLVTFSSDSVIIQDRRSGKTIGSGYESKGLYRLSTPASAVCSATISPSLTHCRLGHPSLKKLQQLEPNLSKLSSLECESCQYGKHSRTSFLERVNKVSSSPFSLVHSDIWGPSRVASVLGFRYFVTFIDDFSRCTWVFLMQRRSELFHIFEKFHNEIKNQFGVSIKILRSDNAKEYFNTPLTTLLESEGILHESSCPNTPQQNGVSERKNRHLVETARTMLLHYKVPSCFWGDAILHSCYLINRMPSSVLHSKIPYNLLFPQEPLHKLPLKVFGCTCFVHDITPGRDKIAPKSLKCIFVGYSRVQKGFRCYCPDTRRFYVSPNVTFFENTPFFSSDSTGVVDPFPDVLPVPSFEGGIEMPLPPSVLPPNPSQTHTVSPFQFTYHRRSTLPPTTTAANIEPADSSPELSLPLDAVPAPVSSPPIASRVGNRSTRNPYPIYNFVSYHRFSPVYNAFISSLSSVSVPKSVKEALSHPGWQQAMVDEMAALHSSGTWDLVPLPPGKTVVGCRWVYNVKVGPDGQVDRLKARLVAKGYTQVFGVDYTDTFSPVAKISSIRIFLSIAAIHHWPLYQLDIKNAFLHGDLKEEVYMEQPPGFVAQGGETNLVCKLKRSLYGLKQSPRAWFGRFSTVLQDFGLIRSKVDHSVFYRHQQGKSIYLVVYVDDIVITGNDAEGMVQLKQHLFKHFETKDLGKLKYFLGIEVAQSKQGICISQRKYALDILEETGMLDCRPIDTPMDPNIKLVPEQGKLFSDPGRYRRLVGKLLYLTVTRPDISFAVSIVSQFLASPCDSHWDAVIRILRYIKKSPGTGVLYKDHGNTEIIGYTDADWAGCPWDRKSTSGYCVFLGGNLISWKSKKQNVVARSSAEAEYRSIALGTCELIWLKHLLSELKFYMKGPIKLMCDNQAALHIASNPVFHERTKHIEIDCHFVREKIASGEIVTSFVGTNDQLADIFTKALRGPRVEYLCNKLGAFDIHAPA